MLEPASTDNHRVVLSESDLCTDQSVRDPARARLLGGGVDGNEWLTTVTGVC